MQGYVLDRVGRCLRIGAALTIVSLLAGCQGIAPEQRPISSGHISEKPPPTPAASNIPEPVRRTPFVPEPVAEAPAESYTVVVNDVPVKELLFALARDASINVDIHPDVSGLATMNAVDQSLAQILHRVSRQLDLRYEINGDSISIQPDTPFIRIYRVDYVDLDRSSTTTSSVSTEIASTSTDAEGGSGGGGNNSTTTVTSSSRYPFWETLVENIRHLVSGSGTFEGLDEEETVIANSSNGVLMVRATGSQHEEVQRYLDEVKAASRRQVLIEATIVEVALSDGYQAGIDWKSLASSAGLSIIQNLTGGATAVAGAVTAPPHFQLQYANSRDAAGNPNGDLTGTVNLLKQFGDTRVLSSPKIMALNNQTALLKVVENFVYFEVKSQSTQGALGGGVLNNAETTAKSVSVGVVMSVTPQINGTDEVTLIVRPTISRVQGTVQDPNPSLVNPVTGVITPNLVPEIAVREMESVLRIGSGQLATADAQHRLHLAHRYLRDQIRCDDARDGVHERRIRVLYRTLDPADGGPYDQGDFVGAVYLGCHRHHDTHRHRFGGGLGVIQDTSPQCPLGRLALDLEIDEVFNDFEKCRLIVQCHYLGAREHPRVAELLEQIHRAREIAVGITGGVAGICVLELEVRRGGNSTGHGGSATGQVLNNGETRAGSEAFPIDAGLIAVAQRHFDDGRLDQDLAPRGGFDLVEVALHLFVLRSGGTHHENAVRGVGNDGLLFIQTLEGTASRDQMTYVFYQGFPERVPGAAGDGGRRIVTATARAALSIRRRGRDLSRHAAGGRGRPVEVYVVDAINAYEGGVRLDADTVAVDFIAQIQLTGDPMKNLRQ